MHILDISILFYPDLRITTAPQCIANTRRLRLRLARSFEFSRAPSRRHRHEIVFHSIWVSRPTSGQPAGAIVPPFPICPRASISLVSINGVVRVCSSCFPDLITWPLHPSRVFRPFIAPALSDPQIDRLSTPLARSPRSEGPRKAPWRLD
jgi:hypothetical protein